MRLMLCTFFTFLISRDYLRASWEIISSLLITQTQSDLEGLSGSGTDFLGSREPRSAR